MTILNEIVANPFLRNAFTALLLLAPLTAMLGIQVVNFRMAFFSDAISHSAFTGIALGVLCGLDPRLTVVAFAVLAGMAITRVRRTSKLSLDTVIGVFHSGIIAFGVAVISARQGLGRDLQQFLYGDILSVSSGEIGLLALLLLATALFSLLNSNRLLAVSVNEELAAASGRRAEIAVYANNMLVALVVAFGIRAVGILLITALLVVPAAAARNLARDARQMFWWNQLICLTSAIFGFIAALRCDSSAGAAIVLVATLWFVVTLFVSALFRK